MISVYCDCAAGQLRRRAYRGRVCMHVCVCVCVLVYTYVVCVFFRLLRLCCRPAAATRTLGS